MPTNSTFKVIYLGSKPTIDPTEGTAGSTNFVAENANALNGQAFNDLTNASVQTFSPVSYSSDDGGGGANRFLSYNQDNFRGNDTFNITDANGNVVQHTFDAIAVYNATVTYANGTTAAVQVNVIQSVTGHTWIAPPSTFTPNAAMLVAQPIQGIQLLTVAVNSGSGLFYNREVLSLHTVPCFARGTLIRTPGGEVPVETLSAGDLVLTRDRGAQPIRWLGSRHLDRGDLQAAPHLRAIRIASGALGENLPAQDLWVSPQHRVLVRSRIAQRMFGADEVLVAAKSLIMLQGIDIDAASDRVEYFHLMFDQHEIVFSNGAETESFYAGSEALKSVGPAAREELFTLFPDLRAGVAPEPARPLLPGRMGRKLSARHAEHLRPLQPN